MLVYKTRKFLAALDAYNKERSPETAYDLTWAREELETELKQQEYMGAA